MRVRLHSLLAAALHISNIDRNILFTRIYYTFDVHMPFVSRKQVDLGTYSYGVNPTVSKSKNLANLTWRLNPKESLSDWTIIVTTTQNADKINEPPRKKVKKDMSSSPLLTEKYFVHKNQLGVGRRRSDYFTRLFQNTEIAESITSTTNIDLYPSAAKAFPAMLDFLYSSNDNVNATTGTAVALRHLSNYFGISELFENVNVFIEEDLSTNTAPIYLCEAAQYRDDKVYDFSLDVCAERFSSIDPRRLMDLPYHLFLDIVTSPKLQCESVILSKRVADYFRSRPSAINADSIEMLTNHKKMPLIDPNNAVFLMKLGIENFQHAGRDDINSLHARCSKAISNTWDNNLSLGHIEKKRRLGVDTDYDNIPAQVKVELLESALCKARKDVRMMKKYAEGKKSFVNEPWIGHDESITFCAIL